jgi:exopolysaccharide biosynthesis protein
MFLLDAVTELAYYRVGFTLKEFIKICLTIAPIIIMIKCMFDLFQIVTNPDKAKEKPKTIARRFISGLIIYLLPVIIDYTFKEMTDYDDTNFVKYYEGASKEKLEEWEAKVEEERKASVEKRKQELIEANKKSAAKRKEQDEQGEKLRKERDTDTSSAPQSNYDITSDPKFDSYTVKASCEGSSLKYKILDINGEYFSLIWVKDPQQQMNLALAANNSYGRATGNVILNNEISSNGYQNHCLVGVNASFFSYSTNSPITGVVISKGQVVKNTGNNGAVMGINKESKLVVYTNKSADELTSEGIRNTVAVSNALNSSMSTGGTSAARTQLAQYDTNNFIFYTGSGTVGGCFMKIHNLTGATEGANLDGGGSRKLYYKGSSDSSVTSIIEGGRPVPDMLYFSGE